jgi:uncharacterized protein DUF6790
MATSVARPSPAARLLAGWPFFIGPLMLAVAEIAQFAQHGSDGWERALLRNALVFLVGVPGIVGATGHIFNADQVAESIGWPKGSPFQYEVGVANLSYGILGIMCSWVDGDFWTATVIGFSVFLWGAAIGHIREMVKEKNFNPGNAGVVFYMDLLIPAFLYVLLFTYK